jgi:protoporphyrinogen oxidase
MPRDLPKYQNDNEYFIKEATHYLKTIDDSLQDEDILSVHASRYGYAQPVCPPGFKECLPPIKTSIDGLFVADTSYYYPEDRSISESVQVGKQMARLYQQEHS